MGDQLVRQHVKAAWNTSSDSVIRPGGASPLGFFSLFSLSVFFVITALFNPFFSDNAFAQNSWSKYYPYIPERREYQAEVGGMWEKDNLYWLGMTAGQHLGTCMFSESQKCQQYIDITGGAGSRESLTVGVLMASMRWQYVYFPKPFSPSFRIILGMNNIRDDERDRLVGSYGAGLGFTAAVHERLQVKWEARMGYADSELWTQALFSISLRIGKWVDYFEERVRKLGPFKNSTD